MQVTPKDASAPIAAFISNCAKERLDYVRELMKYIDVHSYGRQILLLLLLVAFSSFFLCVCSQELTRISCSQRCLNNKEIPKDDRLAKQADAKYSNKVDVMAHYKFYLAFENFNLTDYVTEKLVHAFQATSLPIYMGAPNIGEFLPHPHSIINTADFKSPQHLAEYLHLLLRDEKEYNSYFEWKKLPISQLNVPRSMRPLTCKYCEHNWACRVCLRLHSLI